MSLHLIIVHELHNTSSLKTIRADIMENRRIEVLLIEDSTDDAELIKRKLERSTNTKFQVMLAYKLGDGLEQAEKNPPDLIISDLGLPDSHGLDTVTKILLAIPHIPVVVLSGFDDEAIAIKAVQSGAQDYLVKGQIDNSQLERSIYYSIERARLQQELEHNSHEISRLHGNLLKILENSTDATVVVNEGGHIQFTNPAVEKLFGRKQQTLMNQPFQFPIVTGKTSEIEIKQAGEKTTIAEMNAVKISWEGETANLVSMHDITNRKKTEEAIRALSLRQEAILAAVPDIIMEVDTNKVYTWANKAGLDFFGEDVLGKEASYYFEGEQNTYNKVKPLFSGNESVVYVESWQRRKDGEKRLLAWWCRVLKDKEGKVTGALSTARDITELKNAQETLRISEEKFSKAFLNSPEVIVISDVDNSTIIEANDTFLDLFGYTREEVIGKKATELRIWAIPEERAKTIKILKKEGTVHNKECHFRIKSGEIHTCLFSAEIINIGNRPRMLSVTTDITERKKTEEELRFSDTALRSIHEGVYAMDMDFKITRWNEICEQMLGIKASEAIGKPIKKVFILVEDYPGQNEERLNLLIKRGFNREEQVYRTPRGDIWVDAQAQVIEDKGKRTGWVTLISDITERKKTEEALKQSEEKYRELINSSTDAIVSADQHMRVTIWNNGAEKIFGYTEKEMLGQPVLKIVPDTTRKPMAEGYSRFNKIGASDIGNKIIESIGVRKDGTEVPVELSMSTRKTGGIFIATAIIRDITARKEAEEKLRKIDEMKSEFLSNVSHELRTPLQSISGFTKLIMTGKVPDPETQQEFLQIIDRETTHLGNLINSLLDISRLESGRFQIYKKVVPVHDIFTDSIKMFHSLAREKNITLNVNIPTQLPDMEIDNERMRQVVINLLSNAIKFSDPGSSVNVKASVQDNELLFRVTDHGTGIRREAMSHLFERFYRDEGETVRGGTGLGLYISKQIIEAHNGKIHAESKYGEGSTFSFTLPLNNKGGKKNGKENTGNRRRSGNSKTGRLLTKAGRV
jgi:PAS domain S-box-containing protein